jgi:tetratricopeptide (TPR) repeat protein
LADDLVAVDGWPDSISASAQRAMVRILSWQATLCGLVGNLATADRLLREGLALLDGPILADEDTRFERAHIEWQSGYLLLYSAPGTARQHFAQSLELYQQVGYEFGVAHAQLGLGRAARGVHAFKAAKEALTSSLALHRKLGNRHGEGETLTTLGGLAAREGNFDEAERLIEDSLSITPEIDRYGIAFALGFLGSVRLTSGRFTGAEAPLRQCLALHRDLGMRHYGLHWRFLLGEVYLHLGKYAAARTQAQAVLSRAQELEYDRGRNLGLLLLSELALIESAFALACQCLEETPDPAHMDTIGSREFGQLGVLGLANLGLDRLAEARQQFIAALAWAREARRLRGLTVALGGLALLQAKAGDPERAVELYALASRYPFVAQSRWFEDVIGRRLAVMAASLAPEVLSAARERGQARDLDASVEELMSEGAP